jgi:hypothetical protein
MRSAIGKEKVGPLEPMEPAMYQVWNLWVTIYSILVCMEIR